jgi:propanol-preferring alcohol dehydrogenase
VVVREDYAYEIPEVFDDLAAAPLLCAGIIGFRALERAEVPPGGTLLMVGFGSSAHLVLPIALHRGHEVFVVTRSHGHQQLAQHMGAKWVGSDPRDLPSKPEGAIVFAPVGALVGPVLEAMQRGGRVALAGIHMSAIPELDYEKHLYYERDLRSVTANTREDGERLLVEAAAAGVRPQVFSYPLKEANRALSDMKHSLIDGTGVLIP